jgi:glycosyltransferase involved in cell wall biosynthesis
VAAYTGGSNVASARFRVRQYIPALKALGVEVREFAAAFGSCPPPSKVLRPFWGAAALGDRLLSTVVSHGAEVTLFQREMISTLLTLEPLTQNPRVLDVDDAIWLHRGTAASRLAGLCRTVICGNEFLAENFRQWNPDVRVLPTAVDTTRYFPREWARVSPVKRIGWSGGSSNFPYLDVILPALRVVLDKRKDVIFRVVADRRPLLEGIAEDRIEFIPWSPQTEVQAIQEMTIGIMPLEDTLWARGKCSFKLLTYMACGVPALASPVGMNIEVLAAGRGLGPRHCDEWIAALEWLLDDESQARKMSEAGRLAVANHYSLHALAPRLAAVLDSVARGATLEARQGALQ